MTAEQNVLKTIQEYGLIDRGDRVVLGLSGGPDSLCLLHILNDLKGQLGFELYALHLNHLMRGETAEEDAAWLSAHCEELGVDLKIVKRDIYKLAAESGESVEETGRAARHEALAERAKELGDAKIAFAHNLDDQAETVLMRIFRGTGVHGLAAMEFSRADGVIRPLLNTTRADIEEYCERKGLKPRWDCTNASLDYTRNRIRLKLLPQIAEEYNPNIKNSLARLSANAREDDDCLEEISRGFLPEFTKNAGGGRSISTELLAKLHPAVFKRVVRMVFYDCGLLEDIASTHLNSLRSALLRGMGSGVIQFPKGYRVRIAKGLAVFEKVELERQYTE